MFIFFPLLRTQTIHVPSPYIFHFPSLYLVWSLPLPEGRVKSSREISEQEIFCCPLVIINVEHDQSTLLLFQMMHTVIKSQEC